MATAAFAAIICVYLGAFSSNSSFALYGVVLDENGAPLPGVSVNTKIVSDQTLIPVPWGGRFKETGANVVTGPDGRFKIVGKGIQLHVGLVKSGYKMPQVLGPEYTFEFQIEGTEGRTGSADVPLKYVLLKR